MDDVVIRGAITQVVPMSEADVALLLSHTQYREFRKREVVLREGDVCRSFYLVEHGYLRSCYNKDGITTNLRFTPEGKFAANIKSFRSRTPSETTIEAGEASGVWTIHVRNITEQGNVPPQIARFVRRIALDLLQDSETHGDMLRLYDAHQRYRYIQQYHPELLQRIPLLQLASYLGLSRETLSRVRAKHSR